MRRSKPERACLVLGLALVALAAAGCRTVRGGDGERIAAFSRVRPPVAFEILRDNPGLPVLDLRSRFEFTGPIGHVRGARNVPLDELHLRLLELSPLKDRTFLVYCGHDDCGVRGLELLVKAGYEEAILMDGGIDAWVLDGFGTVTGPPPPMSFTDEDSEVIVVD